MSREMTHREQATALLEAFLEGTLSPEQFVARCPAKPGDRLLDDIVAEFRRADALETNEDLRRTARIALQAIREEWVPEAFHNALEIDVPRSVSVRRSFTVQIALAVAAIIVMVAALAVVLSDPSNRFDRAIRKGDLTGVRKLLAAHPELLNSEDEGGGLPLHRAAESGHADVVRFFLDAGADVNVRRANGQTPLHVALERQHEEVAALLREHGAQQ
jgi:ankyrin repeat protein